MKYYKEEDEYRKAKAELEKLVKLNKQKLTELDANFYYMTQNEDEYIELANVLVDKNYQEDALAIANILGSVRFVKKPENLLALEKFGLKAVELDNSLIYNTSLALVYCVLKNEDKANEYFMKAEEVGKLNNDPYLPRLEEIKEGYMQMFGN